MEEGETVIGEVATDLRLKKKQVVCEICLDPNLNNLIKTFMEQ